MTTGSLTGIIRKRVSGLKLGLRNKLLIFFIIAVIPSLIFTVFAFSVIGLTLSSQIEGYQKAVVEGARKLVEHYAVTCQNNLITLGGEGAFRSAVAQEDLAGIRSAFERVYTRSKIYSFLAVAVRDPSGDLKILASYPSDKYRALTGDAEINEFLEENFQRPASRISGAFNFRGGKEVFTTFPIRGAVIIGGLDIDNLYQALEKVNPEGSFALADSSRRILTPGSGDFSELLTEKGGLVRFDGGKRLAYFEFDPELGWWTVLVSPYRVTYRSMIYLRILAFVFMALGLATAFYLALRFSKKLALPISELTRGSRILGEGNLGYRINIRTGDELEELAGEFNRMGDQLKKSYEMMEEKIQGATKSLQDAFVEIEEKNIQLERADTLKSEFLASMSHELRTPMNAIIGFTALLKDGIYGRISVKQQDILGKVIKSTRHLLNLINDILDLSKIEAGRMELLPEKIRLKLLIDEVRDEVAPLAREKGLEFSTSAPDDIECFQDYTRVRQIVMNLVSNAVKFTEKGAVTINCGLDGDCFFFEVRDTGIGIKEEDLGGIFEEFVQADGSITREFGGTGLGLSIVKKLAGMMKGRVEVESKWREGTTFRVFLPVDGGDKEGERDETLNS